MNTLEGRRWILSTLLLFSLLLAAAKVFAQEPIPSGPDAPTWVRFMEKAALKEPRLDDEYDAHTSDPPELHERARRLVMQVKPVFGTREAEFSHEAIHKLGTDLMASGSKDPVVIAITMATAPNVDDKETLRKGCQKAIEDVIKRYDPQQQIDVIDWCQTVQLNLHNTHRKERKKYRLLDPEVLSDAYLRWFVSRADDLSYQRVMWMRFDDQYRPSSWHIHKRLVIEIAKKAKTKKIHPWMQHMLDAAAAKTKGEHLRLESEDEYKNVFREAGRNYKAAWKLAPQFPEAAAELLQLSRGEFVDGTPREWFDRTMAAEIDYVRAYTFYRTHLRSEGREALIRFGKECAATRRYDTKVPFELIECLWAVENHSGENVWAREGVYEMLRDLFQAAIKSPKYIQGPQTDATRRWLIAEQIVMAARAGRFEEIEPLWKKTDNPNLQRAARIFRLGTSLGSLKSMASKAAAGNAKLVKEVEAALAAVRDKESVAAAEESIEAAADELESDDKRLVQWQSTLKLYREYYAGRWADIIFPRGTVEHYGEPDWKRKDDFTIESRGTHYLRLPYLARLSVPFEVTFDISTVKMPKEILAAGVMLGRMRPLPNDPDQGQGEFFGLNSHTGKAVTRMYVPSYYNASLGETNRVLVKVWYTHREFFVNGRRVTSGRNFPFNPAGGFMLWAPGPQESKPVVRYSKLRVRRIDIASPPFPLPDVTAEQLKEQQVEYYTERIENDSKHLWHYFDRGYAYYSLGRFDEAADDFEQMLANRPKWNLALMWAGRAQAGVGNYQKAIDRYERVLKIVPNATHVLERLAWLEATCKDPRFRNADKAIERVGRAIKLSKGEERGYFLTLAAAHAGKGDFKAARKALKKAGRLDGHWQKALLGPMKEAFDAGKPFRAD